MPRSGPLLFLAACFGGGQSPPTKPTEPRRVEAAPAPPRPGTPFGHYTAVQPDGYTIDRRTDSISFDKGDIKIILVDGAELGPPAPGKCLGQLEAFASGVVTGLAETAMRIDMTNGRALANGCRLDGKTSAGDGLVEAASLDLGAGGVALALLVHEHTDDGASAVFDRVLASIALKK